MNVSFSPNVVAYNSFQAKQPKRDVVSRPMTNEEKQTEILSKRTKSAVITCFCAAIGLNIIYFAMKRKFRITKIKNFEQSLVNTAKANQKAKENNRIPTIVLERQAAKEAARQR